MTDPLANDPPEMSQRDADRLTTLVDYLSKLETFAAVTSADGFTAAELAEAKAMLTRMNNEGKAKRKGGH